MVPRLHVYCFVVYFFAKSSQTEVDRSANSDDDSSWGGGGKGGKKKKAKAEKIAKKLANKATLAAARAAAEEVNLFEFVMFMNSDDHADLCFRFVGGLFNENKKFRVVRWA